MKRLYFIAFLCLSLTQMKGQAPQALNYQAVARTADGVIIPTQSIGVRFSILDGSVNGTVLYSETHQTATNSYGLFTLAIGRGTPLTSAFSNVNWASGTDKYLKVEIAPAGGNNYQLQGTTQLLSVPYALYSEKTRLIAGPGININGNTISNSLWSPDGNGIHNISGNVGVRANANAYANAALTVSQENTGGFSGAMDIFSGDTWQTVINFRNTTVSQTYQFNLAGSGNIDQNPGSFGIFHNNNLKWVWHTNPANSNLGIGSYTHKQPLPKSRLHIFNGDINIEDVGRGIIIKSPNGNCWRVTVDDIGALVTTAMTCPN